MLAVCQGLIIWNNFVLPLILTNSRSTRVLPLQLFSFETEFGVNVPGVLAAMVLATLPIVLVFIVGYRSSGLAAGLSTGELCAEHLGPSVTQRSHTSVAAQQPFLSRPWNVNRFHGAVWTTRCSQATTQNVA